MAICFASVNGQWTNWSRWSQCSRTCNGGTRSRRRSCTNPPPSNGGAPCSGPGSQSQFCGRIPCQFIGVWILSQQSLHLHFFLANFAIQGGNIDSVFFTNRYWRRDVGNQSLSQIIFNTVICFLFLSFINLFVFMLQSVGRVLSHWSSWSQCSKSCGGGTRTRTRSCMNRPFFSFVRPVCSGHLSEDQQCNNNRCVVPGNNCNVNRKKKTSECNIKQCW